LKRARRRERISGNDLRVRARIETLDAYSAHADHAALLKWLANRAPVGGSISLDHGEPPALERLATDAASIAGLPHPIVPLLGERFQLGKGAAAQPIGEPRPGATELIASDDWRNLHAAFVSSLEDRLRALPSNAARRRAQEAAERALRQG